MSALRGPVARGQFQPRRLPPARQPVQQLQVRQHQCRLTIVAAFVRLRQPLDELPIAGREQLLFVPRASRQLDDLAQGLDLLTGARAVQVKLHGQTMAPRVFLVGLRLADRPQKGARPIEVRRLGGEEPRLQLPDMLLFPSRLLHLGEPVEVGVGAQLGRHRPPGA